MRSSPKIVSFESISRTFPSFTFAISSSLSGSGDTSSGVPSSKVAISLEVALAAGQNVAQASDAIRAAVSEQMDNVLGLADYSIDISIAEFAGMDAAKKSRVS